MKKIYLALMCVVSLMIMTACGGGNKNNNAAADGEAEVKKEAKASKASNLSVGDRYAFAGFASADIEYRFK